MAIPGFFGKVVPTKVYGVFSAPTAIKPAFIEVGDVEDSGFRAVAAAIISNVLSKPKFNQEWLNLLLEQHAKYVTIPSVIGHSLTPVQRFEKMLAKPEVLAQFTRDLAYTLRQIAVDEMCQFPLKYHAAFIGKNAPTSLLEMRQSERWGSKIALEALANALQMPMTLNKIESGKELQKQYHYGPDKAHASCDEVIILQERNHFMPKVMQLERFKTAAAHVTKPVSPLSNPSANDSNLSVIRERIKKESLELVTSFEHHVHRLTTMMDAGEVNKENLLAVYMAGMTKRDSPAYIKKAGMEHGSRRFFDDIIDSVKHAKKVTNITSNINHDDPLISELIYALARDITMGCRDENNVFAQFEFLENQQKRSKNLSY